MCFCNENCTGKCCIEGYYKCSSEYYEITDLNKNSIKTLTLHSIPSTDSEINYKERIKYCSGCYNYIDVPTVYDSSVNKFKTSNDKIYECYPNFLEDNIIYNFTNIPCEHCSDIFKKAYYTIEDTSIKIYDENNNLLKINDLITNDFQEFILNFTTDISKKILYCERCNFIIFNNLAKYKFS
jgi:hypothetical protein